MKKRGFKKKQERAGPKKTLSPQWLLFLIPFFILAVSAFYIYFQPSSLQKFNDLVVEGSSPEGATLQDGLLYAQKTFQAQAAQGFSWGSLARKAKDAASGVSNTAEDVFSQASEFAGDVLGYLENEAQKVIRQTRFQKTPIAKASKEKKFKILIIGNNVNHWTLVNWCNYIYYNFSSLPPYSAIHKQFTIDCGTFPFTINYVNDNPAAQAWLLLLAKAKKQELGYDYVFVLQNGQGRSFALPTFASLVFYEGKTTPLLFLHEFSHMYAGLADEYVRPQDTAQLNNILAKLNLPFRIDNQLDLFQKAGLIDPPNCLPKTVSCKTGWYEGCANQAQNLCRPSESSIMKSHLNSYFNVESIFRILAVARGTVDITTGSGLLR